MDRNPGSRPARCSSPLPSRKAKEDFAAFPDAPGAHSISSNRLGIATGSRGGIRPNLAKLYRRGVADLEKLLDPELGREAMDLIHSMSPRSKSCSRQDRNGVHLELRRPWRILHLCSVSTMQNAQAVGAGRLSV